MDNLTPMNSKFNGNPLITIVVSNFNGLRFGVLSKCLNSILRISYDPYELILVDNCSDDGSAEYVRGFFRLNRVIIVQNAENNYVKGLNMALQVARGEFLVYLNNDIEVDPHFLEDIVKVFRSDDEVAVVQCKLLDARNIGKVDSLGETIDILGNFTSLHSGQKDPRELKTPFEILYSNGSAFAVSAKVLRLLGGFDPTYYSGYEDVDMGLRVRMKGYKIVCCPTSIVYHARGTTLLSESMRTFSSYHFNKNKLCTVIKIHPSRTLFIVIPLLTFTYFAEFAYISLIQKNFNRGLSRPKALIWILRNLRHILQERKEIWFAANYDNVARLMQRGVKLPRF